MNETVSFRKKLVTVTTEKVLINRIDHGRVLVNLFYLLVASEGGTIKAKEASAGQAMIKAEGISQAEFDSFIESAKTIAQPTLYAQCVQKLKSLDRDRQIRYVAWLSVVANSDGFMDKEEWQFIYSLYHIDLGLNLNEIMNVQKTLLRDGHERGEKE